jgi:hypothetical protein
MGRSFAHGIGATDVIDWAAKATLAAPSSGKANPIVEHGCALHDSSSSCEI